MKDEEIKHQEDIVRVDSNQESLFDDIDERKPCEKEWQDMPEFSLKNLTPMRTIKIHFRSQKDIDKFSETIEQKILPNYKSYWFPEAKVNEVSKYRYVDEKTSREDSES